MSTPTSPNSEENYYGWRENRLVHLSAGAVIINAEGKILTMYLGGDDAPYVLPTRTHEPSKSLEETLHSISTKVGWKLQLEKYLGSTITEFLIPGDIKVKKNVIWYLCTPLAEVDRDPEERTASARIEWKTKEELMEIFAGQAHVASDVDQRPVLEML